MRNYVKAVDKGVLKVMSKMGISTLQSYHGAQIFEAVGLNQDVIDGYFTWTAVAVGGIGSTSSPKEASRGTERGLPAERPIQHTSLPDAGGQYQWRATASTTSSTRRRSTSSSTPAAPATTSSSRSTRALVDDQSKRLRTLRGLMDFKPGDGPCRSRRSSRSSRSCAASRRAR